MSMPLTSKGPTRRATAIDRLWWSALIVSLICLIAVFILDHLALY